MPNVTRSCALAALLLTSLLATASVESRENRVLKCKTSAARGAKSTGGPALVANIPRAMTPIDLNAVQMTDKALTRKVVVEGLWAQRTEADTLLITARLVNCTKKPLVVQARSNFMDAAQIPTEPVSAWKTIFLPPRATSVYQERSIGMGKVAAYLVELRTE